jgi:hypothetical protein
MEQVLGEQYESVERTIQQSIRSLEEARDVLLCQQQILGQPQPAAGADDEGLAEDDRDPLGQERPAAPARAAGS